LTGSKFVRADLHVHSRSDEPAAPLPSIDDFLSMAKERGISIIGITDHNSVDRVDVALQSGARLGITVLPGIEVTTHEGHLLALFAPEDLGSLKEFASKGQLRLEEDVRDKVVRSTRSLLDLVNEIGSRGGLAVPAHVDGDGGVAGLMNAKSLASLLMSPNLSALEFATKTGLETYFTEVDRDDARRAAWLARQQVPELRYRGLARVMSSDAHSPDKVGLERSSRTLTRLRLDQPTYAAIRNAIVNSPRARCKAEVVLPPSYPRLLTARFEGGFLDGVTVEFNSNLNCIIGGRGSGKSTVLLAIRAALDALDVEQSNDDPDAPDRMPDQTTVDFIDETGSQRRAFRQRDRTPVDSETGAPIQLLVEGLAQGESGMLAREYQTSPAALVAFLDQFVDIEAHQDKEEQTLRDLKDNEPLVTGSNEGINRIPQLEEDVKALETQLAAAQKSQLDRVAAWAGWLASEAPFLERLLAEIESLASFGSDGHAIALPDLAREFGVDLNRADLKRFVEGPRGLPALVSELAEARATARKSASTTLKTAATQARAALSQWQAHHRELNERLNAKRKELEGLGLKVEADAVMKIAGRLEQNRKLLAQLKARRDQYRQLLRQRDQLVSALHSNREALYERRRASLRSLVAMANRASHGPIIHIKCERAAIRTPWKDWITGHFYSRSPRADRIAEAMTPIEMAKALLAGQEHLRSFTMGTGERCFSDADISEHAEGARTWVSIFELEIMLLSDRIRLQLEEPGTGQRRDFDHLSEGQQRSVLLSLMLCAEGRAPLILDQPEDHLDAPYVATALVGHLEAVKERRQVIVATHSANLTVLGDAELVIPMRAEAGRGFPVDAGAVDNAVTRDRVCELLEGGLDAFRRRAARYGLRV